MKSGDVIDVSQVCPRDDTCLQREGRIEKGSGWVHGD
jgi:hypothetical protein